MMVGLGFGGGVARYDLLNPGGEILFVAERNEDLGHQEQRRNQNLNEVVDQRRAAAFEDMAGKLKNPAADKKHRKDDGARARG